MSLASRSEDIDINDIKKMNIFQRLARKLFPLGYTNEFKELFALAWPAILTSFFQLFLQTVSIIVCGHLDKLQLDAVALANSMINVFGISIGMGLSTACDTFFSQTFGSENKKQVGIYLQRSLIIMNIAATLICCVHINVEPIFNLLGQQEEVSKMSANYMLLFLPGVFFDFNFLTLARYLQNQNIVFPSMVCALVGNIVNVVSQVLCIYVFKFSYLASAVCQASSLGVMFFTQLAYILISKKYEETWDGWNLRGALGGWGKFVRLAIPGIFLVGLEEWSFEIATFLAGVFGAVQLGIQSILFQIEAITYMIPLGCSIAVNIRVGQHLGANRPDHAKTAFRVGVSIALVAATIMGTIILILRDYIPQIFTNDEEIVMGVSRVLVLSAFFQYSDGFSATSSGALRGCGRQLTGAVLLFFGYYVISLPIGISLGFVAHMQVYGLWLGLLVGISLEALIFVIVVSKTDWDYQCRKAQLVAFGEMGEDSMAGMDHETSGTETDHETDPLLGPKRKRHKSVSSFRSARRASLTARDLDNLEDSQTSETGQRLACKRLPVFLLVITAVAVASVVRVFQMPFCVPEDNIPPEYAGILPLCNETFNSTIGI